MKSIAKVLMLVAVLALPLFAQKTVQRTITTNLIQNINGWDVETWADSRGGQVLNMELYTDGTFDGRWTNSYNTLVRTGKKFSSSQTISGLGSAADQISLRYDVSNFSSTNGATYMCVYGWTRNQMTEWYIVDDWRHWHPPTNNSNGYRNLGTVTSDGGTYDIIVAVRDQQPSIDGTRTFLQIFSIRRTTRTSGTINVSAHFNRWAELVRNQTAGNQSITFSNSANLYEVSFCIEGFGGNTGSSGRGTVNELCLRWGSGNSNRLCSRSGCANCTGGTGTAPAITTGASLPGATVGTSYSQTIAATGTTPITWAVSAGSLPAGLTLNASTGVISGTPTGTAGTSTFTVRATNSAGNNTRQFTIVVSAAVVAPTITTSSLPNATVGTAYNQTLAATGTAPITWTVSIGTLPAGLTLSSAGVISGTPTAAGPSTFTVRAANSAGNVTRQLSITVAAGLSISPSSLPNATVGTVYSQQLTASGGSGTGTVAWTRTGTLPAGLTLSSAGLISGTPTTAGTSNFTITATRSGVTATINLSITVVSAFTISPSSLPNGTVGTVYSQQLATSGGSGTGTVTWARTSGTLPAGLTLSSAGVISGTPTTAGTSNFTITATRSGVTATINLSITVVSAQSVTITVTFNAGTNATVTPTTAQTNTDGFLTLAALPTPTRTNFAFNGWFTTSSGSTGVTLDDKYTANTTIFAQWSQIRTVTFNPQDGTVNPTTAQTGAFGRLASLPVPTRDGYVFTGWFTEATGGTEITLDRQYNLNTTIHARWTEITVNTFAITFNPNGGFVSPTIETTGANGRLSTLPVPVRERYNFAGWWNGETEIDETTVFDAHTIVIARWVIIPYIITFDANGGTVDPETAETGETNRLSSLPVPERDGFNFTGWFVDVSDPVGITANYVFTADMTLTAKWSSAMSVLSPDRNPVNPKDEVEFFAPATVLAGEFTTGPNPVNRQSGGVVNFFWQGKYIQSAALTIFDASGNVVNRVKINDKKNNKDGNAVRRVVGSWDLTDTRGRTVGGGTYLVNGVITVDGKKEKVSVILGVR